MQPPWLYSSYVNGSSESPLELATLLHAAYAAEAEVESRLAGIGLSLAKLLALKALSDSRRVAAA